MDSQPSLDEFCTYYCGCHHWQVRSRDDKDESENGKILNRTLLNVPGIIRMTNFETLDDGCCCRGKITQP